MCGKQQWESRHNQMIMSLVDMTDGIQPDHGQDTTPHEVSCGGEAHARQ
jgi:hypothetical protein